MAGRTGQAGSAAVPAALPASEGAPDLKASFAPVCDEHTRVLILGSLPGERSLAAVQYYAHPQNQFWHLLGEVVGEDLRALPYERRLRGILARGIGLWDVVGRARRQGSLDSAIRGIEGNDLAGLVRSLPALRCVAFNGATAGRLGRRALEGVCPAAARLDLPSSSAAHATLSFAQKLVRWRELASACGDGMTTNESRGRSV